MRVCYSGVFPPRTQVPPRGFQYFDPTVAIDREPGGALGPLLRLLEMGESLWGKGGLAAWLRFHQPNFHFIGEVAGGPGVTREAMDSISLDMVRGSPAPHSPNPNHMPLVQMTPLPMASPVISKGRGGVATAISSGSGGGISSGFVEG
ncbi:unnamed protein product, partial [Discosporangium mesarthrocarpum]